MKRISSKRGQSMVEFAVVLPVLLMLILAIFEFGRVYNAQVTVTQAAREGARRGVIYTTNNTSLNNARNQALAFATAAGLEMDRVTVTAQYVDVAGDTNDAVLVTVTSAVQIVTPVIGQFFTDSQVTVTGAAQMRAE